MWMCFYCSKSFVFLCVFKIYEVKQYENVVCYVFKCGMCYEKFEYVNLFYIYMWVYYNVKVCCLWCKDIFEYLNVLKFYIKVYYFELVCVVCGLKFDYDKFFCLYMEYYYKVGSKGVKQCVIMFFQQIGEKVKIEDVFVEMKGVFEEIESVDIENYVVKY